jgi:hypothetical protein
MELVDRLQGPASALAVVPRKEDVLPEVILRLPQSCVVRIAMDALAGAINAGWELARS